MGCKPTPASEQGNKGRDKQSCKIRSTKQTRDIHVPRLFACHGFLVPRFLHGLLELSVIW
jgi:hypothetical protein